MEFNFNFNFIYAKPNLNSSCLQNNCILIYHCLYFHAEKDFYVMVNFLYFILLFLVSKWQLLVVVFCCCFYKLFIVYFLVSKGWFASNQHRIESYENAVMRFGSFFSFSFFFLFLVQSQFPSDKLDPDPDVVLHISNSPIHVYPS